MHKIIIILFEPNNFISNIFYIILLGVGKFTLSKKNEYQKQNKDVLGLFFIKFR